jgi:small subunit ribosomal protein S10
MRHSHKGLLRLAQVALKSYHPKFVGDLANDIRRSATQMGLAVSGATPLPTQKSRYTVLRSPMGNKKAMDHFQKNTHKRLIEVYGKSAAGSDAGGVVHFLRYLEHTIMPLHPGARARVTLFSNEQLLPRDLPPGKTLPRAPPV